MLARTKPSAGRRRRARDARSTAAEPAEAPPAAYPARYVDAAPLTAELVPSLLRLRRLAVAPQDQAIYSCQCGFVFEAQVSTSVGCPHCGDAQAW